MKVYRKMNLKKDNSGVALLSVMIALVVCMLVASIVLEVTYNSLLARKVYKTSTDTKYTAENVVDSVEAVVQDIAYYSASQNGLDPSKSFIETATSTICGQSGALSLTDANAYEKITDYIFGNLDIEVQKIFAAVDEDGKLIPVTGKDGDGNDVVVGYKCDYDKFKIKAVRTATFSDSSKKGSLAFELNFKYTDEKGFYSEVNTDLVMNDIVVRKTASAYSLGSYSMFTGGGVQFVGNEQLQNRNLSLYVQEGNVYVGTMGQAAPTAMEISNCAVDFTGAAIINGDVYLSQNAVWLLTGGKDSNGNRTEVTVRGNIYIDDDSAIVVSKDIDLMCHDIILSDGSSAFTAGKNCYKNYQSGSDYKAYFPFNANNASEITAANAQNIKDNMQVEDFVQRKTGGCIMVSNGTKADVVKYDGNGFKYVGDNKDTGALINKSETCIPEAKTTVWTYDNKAIQIDPEMETFVNIPLLYAQGKTLPNTALHAHYAQIVKHTESSSISRVTYPDTHTGSAYEKLTIVDNKMHTSDLISAGLISQANSNQSGVTVSNIIGKNIVLNGKTITNAAFKIGVIQDCGENLEDSAAQIAFICTYGAYTVQMNGGSIIGIVMSADKCTYKVLGGKRIITAYSILNAKDDAVETTKTDLDKLINELQYLTFIRGLTQASANSALYNDYGVFMLDSMFTGGMKSFTSDGGGAAGGSVEVDASSMYDFITVENWSQD